MAAPKAKTLIERLGFRDPELTTPEHDEMFIVCMQSAQSILELTVNSEEKFDVWRKMHQDAISHDLYYRCTSLLKDDIYEGIADLSYVPTRVVPEKPIVAQNNFIIGFVDLLIHANVAPESQNALGNVFHKDSSGYNPGRFSLLDVVDEQCTPITGLFSDFKIFIEIKPSIKSVGELIRQVQTYRQYERDWTSIFVVISKTKAFKDILRLSKILLIDYDDVKRLNAERGTDKQN